MTASHKQPDELERRSGRSRRSTPNQDRIPLEALRDKLKLPEDWEKRWCEMDAELEGEMLNGRVFPEEQ